MIKKKRKIINIDEEKCNGCGQCLPGCPEGALRIVDGKARLVRESYCDGLGACLGHCPQGALQVYEREADEYDANAVLAHLEKQSPGLAEKHREHLRAHGMGELVRKQDISLKGCPSEKVSCWGKENGAESSGPNDMEESGSSGSALCHWPVKLHLIPPAADFLKNADLLLVADCVPFAYGNMHKDFIKGKAVAAGCPKFDDIEAYADKIQQILESVIIRSITVVYMEISCCSGLIRIVRDALVKSGNDIPFEAVLIGVNGDVIKREIVAPG